MSEPRRKRVLCLGAGVQSSTILLMSLGSELPPLDAAIFADTGWEPPAVYSWLQWLESQAEGKIPIHRVSAGNIREEILAKNTRYASPPFHLLNTQGKKGMTRRQCTKGYKIEPIERKIRELAGIIPRSRGPRTVVVEQWFGISLDEIYRMRSSETRWKVNCYPLVDRRMSRADCLRWMAEHGYPAPPRSACIGCPFHSDAEWRRMRNDDPESWEDACEFDHAIRKVGLRGLNGVPYLHASLRPLDEVDLSTAAERGQGSLFNNECQGVCGV